MINKMGCNSNKVENHGILHCNARKIYHIHKPTPMTYCTPVHTTQYTVSFTGHCVRSSANGRTVQIKRCREVVGIDRISNKLVWTI